MKKHIILLLVSAIGLVGCSEKEAHDTQKGYGSFEMICAADSNIDINSRTTNSDYRPSGNEFSLLLTGQNYEGKWATVADFAAADTLFLEGQYKAEIAFGDPNVEGFGKPHYKGKAQFNIKALIYDQKVEIKAKIENSLVVVRATDKFLSYFKESKFAVTTASGNLFNFTPSAADYTGEPAYVKAATTIKVNGTARRQSQTGQDEGQAVKFDEQVIEATKARTRHIFEFDAKTASSATLNIYIGVDENGEDKYVETRVLDIELNEGAIPPTE